MSECVNVPMRPGTARRLGLDLPPRVTTAWLEFDLEWLQEAMPRFRPPKVAFPPLPSWALPPEVD